MAERLETDLGFSFMEGLSVHYTPRARMLRAPECVLFDAQHTLWASGGITQFECNQFILDAAPYLSVKQMEDPLTRRASRLRPTHPPSQRCV